MDVFAFQFVVIPNTFDFHGSRYRTGGRRVVFALLHSGPYVVTTASAAGDRWAATMIAGALTIFTVGPFYDLTALIYNDPRRKITSIYLQIYLGATQSISCIVTSSLRLLQKALVCSLRNSRVKIQSAYHREYRLHIDSI